MPNDERRLHLADIADALPPQTAIGSSSVNYARRIFRLSISPSRATRVGGAETRRSINRTR